MIPNLSPLNLAARWTAMRLRPPSRKRLLVLKKFTPDNQGNSYRLEAGEAAVCPGSGTVTLIRSIFPSWEYTPGSAVGNQLSYEVTIDHGNDLWTTIHGLQSLSVQTNQVIHRGDALGATVSDEIFFQIKWLGHPYDPTTISRHFRVQDDQYALGRTGYLREAPDLIGQVFSSSLAQVIAGGIHYFVNIFGQRPTYLVNVSFKQTTPSMPYTGPAVVGSPGDFWNLYLPRDLTVVNSTCYCNNYYSYGPGEPCFNYSTTPYLALATSADSRTPAWLESEPPLYVVNSGTAASWNAMLGGWLGGYDVGVPVQSVFRLHNLPPGNYEIYCYADQVSAGSGSDYYLQIDNGPILHQATTPTGAGSFINGNNYVVFTGLSVAFSSILRIEILGFLSGVQIRRV